MDKLDLILQKLEKLDALEAGQKELYQLVRSIHHRQEVGDVKLEAISMDVHKLHGELAAFREETHLDLSRFDRHMRAVENDLDRTIERVDQLEEPRS